MRGIRVVVTGGRDFADIGLVFRELDRINVESGIMRLAQGGAMGADECAMKWAEARQVPVMTYLANWHTEGKAAGPLRNARMLDAFAPDLVVAFPGGRGTASCVNEATKRGIEVLEVTP